MAFTWSSTGVGEIIKATHLTELQNNIDSIKDNIACITDKTSDNSSYNNTVDSGDKSSAKSTYRNGVDTGYNYGVDGSYNSSIYGTNYSNDNGSDYSTYNSNYKYPVHSVFNSTES